MFPGRYFPNRMFTPRYFPARGKGNTPVVRTWTLPDRDTDWTARAR